MIKQTNKLRDHREVPSLPLEMESTSRWWRPPPHTVGMSWRQSPPAVRVGSVPGRPRMRLSRELVSPRYLNLACARPPLVPNVVRTLVTGGTREEGLSEAAGTGRWVLAASVHLPPACFPPPSHPQGGRGPLLSRMGASDLGLGPSRRWGGSLRTPRWAPPEGTVLWDGGLGPLENRGWPLRVLGASRRRVGPWWPRMGFRPRVPGPRPSHRGCGLHSPRGPPAKGSGFRQPLEGVFLTLSTPRAASARAASFRGVPQPGLLVESGRLGPSALFSSRSLPPPGYCFVGEWSSFFAQI